MGSQLGDLLALPNTRRTTSTSHGAQVLRVFEKKATASWAVVFRACGLQCAVDKQICQVGLLQSRAAQPGKTPGVFPGTKRAGSLATAPACAGVSMAWRRANDDVECTLLDVGEQPLPNTVRSEVVSIAMEKGVNFTQLQLQAIAVTQALKARADI